MNERQLMCEERQLEEDYASGLLTLSEFNRSMQELQREAREAAMEEAEKAAEAAYYDALGW